MGTVLVRLPGGAGVVRSADGGAVVTADVDEGDGTYLSEDDPYQPVNSWLDADRSVVGGLLPPGAVSVEVIDGRGTPVAAVIGDGAYAAILAEPNDLYDPIVCCRDAGGALVRRPLPADPACVAVTDTTEPCPACGEVEYDECVLAGNGRAGRATPDDTTMPSPIVVCRVCGHQEPEGTFYGASAGDADDEAGRQVHIARARLQRWYSNLMTIRAATFPIYAAEGWPAQIEGSGLSGDQQISITIGHYPTLDADMFAGGRPRIRVTTSRERRDPDTELRIASKELEQWVSNDGSRSRWPHASRAAITLWLAARRREARGHVLAAPHSAETLTIDGAPERFLTLTAPSGRWVAIRRHHDLTITIAAHDLEPSALTMEPVADPVAQLLGPRPPDPDAP